MRGLLSVALLALVVAFPISAGGQPEDIGAPEIVLTDSRGDVRTGSFAGNGIAIPGPIAGFLGEVDLVSLAATSENETHLELVLTMAGMTRLDHLLGLAELLIYVRFSSSDLGASYEIFHRVTRSTTASGVETTTHQVNLCLVNPLFGGCDYQDVEGRLSVETSSISMGIPKASFVGRAPLQPVDPERLSGLAGWIRPGDAATNWSVELQARLRSPAGLAPIWLSDSMPDGGNAERPYVFKKAMTNGRVSLLHGEDWQDSAFVDDRLPLIIGPPSSLEGIIQNLGAVKELVTLAIQLPSSILVLDLPDAALAVPAEGQRRFSLTAGWPSNVRHGDLETVALMASASGESDLGQMPLRFVAVQPIPRGEAMLYFQTGGSEGSPPGERLSLNFAGPGREGASANYPGSWTLSGGSGLAREWLVDATMDTWLYEDLIIRGAVKLALSASATTEASFDAAAQLLWLTPLPCYDSPPCYDRNLLSEASAVVTLAPAPSTVRFNFSAIRQDFPLHAFAGKLGLSIRFSQNSDVADPSQGITVYPADSGVALVTDVAGSKNPESTGSIRIYHEWDSVEFVNAGKDRGWAFLLANEGSEDLSISLDADAPPGWAARILPAGRFSLNAGAQLRYTLIVSAPPGASEGDNATVSVRAVNIDDEAVVAQATLRAIATSALELDAGAGVGEPDPQTVSMRLDDHRRSLSSITFSAATISILGMLGGLRYRRTNR